MDADDPTLITPQDRVHIEADLRSDLEDFLLERYNVSEDFMARLPAYDYDYAEKTRSPSAREYLGIDYSRGKYSKTAGAGADYSRATPNGDEAALERALHEEYVRKDAEAKRREEMGLPKTDKEHEAVDWTDKNHPGLLAQLLAGMERIEREHQQRMAIIKSQAPA